MFVAVLDIFFGVISKIYHLNFEPITNYLMRTFFNRKITTLKVSTVKYGK